MSVLGGRGGRSDDWSTQHARAQARASELLDAPLDPNEARWLEEHLGSCPACAAVAADYANQRLELRGLRDRTPEPPRDLWARTSAAIEREGRHRSTGRRERSRLSILAPYGYLAAALVVALVVGTTIYSPRPTIVPGTPGPSGPITAATQPPSPGPTPLIVARKEVDYVSRDLGGGYNLNTTEVSEVCPKEASTCATTEPTEVHSIGPLSSPQTVFGSGDAPLVVLGDGDSGSSVFAVARPEKVLTPSQSPDPTPPTATPTMTASILPSQTQVTASPTASSTPTDPPASTAPPSTSPTPAGMVEIASDVEVVDTTAAYAPDGTAFAFTARPSDGSHGPDIYLWKVGDAKAAPITSDHRSVFGSWAGDTIVGSTVVSSADGQTNEPAAFTVSKDGDSNVALPQTGLAWRPAVDPTEGSAVYWAGSLEPTTGDLGWKTVEGRLVLGRWSVGRDTAAGPAATPLNGDQTLERAETTISEGPLTDWDARWDETGTRLAVWIADTDDPTVGKLSLYVVDPDNGRIDLQSPPLSDSPALAGFSIADGRLAWAAPTGGNDKTSRVLILAWTNDGFGQVESAPGDVLLVR